MLRLPHLALASLLACPIASLFAQATPASLASGSTQFDPAIHTRYAPHEAEEIRAVMDRVLAYLETCTPPRLVDRETGEEILDFATPNPRAFPARGDFQLSSYEWGVTYTGMLAAAEATGEARYMDYVRERLHFIAAAAPRFAGQEGRVPFRGVNAPRSLDDSGAMAAAFIKAERLGLGSAGSRAQIDRYLQWITEKQFRFEDGTLARNRPLERALWLDDLYMSVPALAQMAVLTGDSACFDDAARQLIQFHARMFVPAKGLFMHGWIDGMEPHPAFHWGRANGWAIMAAAELLSVLPEEHPRRAEVLAIYRAHAAGLAAWQGRDGRWHQLLDRNDSYLETSASAMFVFALARGINRGWLDPLAYGPCVTVGWNAVAGQVNAQGQVENTCVGTGMAFEPRFYYERKVSALAAHGYGPVLLAGAEMLTLYAGKGAQAQISDEAIQFAPSPARH